jgi:hypothetical protein
MRVLFCDRQVCVGGGCRFCAEEHQSDRPDGGEDRRRRGAVRECATGPDCDAGELRRAGGRGCHEGGLPFSLPWRLYLHSSGIVVQDIFRRYPSTYEGVIPTLCANLEELDEPEAKASLIWIIGEYANKIDNADELLGIFVDTFTEESYAVSRAFVPLALITPFSLADSSGHRCNFKR